MIRKLAGGIAAAAIVLGSVALAAPASATTHYYQQKVTGATPMQCTANGNALADEKQAEGYLVTWLGCGHNTVGYVSWSDG